MPMVDHVRRTSWFLLSGALLLVGSTPVLGHHSYGNSYLESDTIEIEGQVVEFQYKNPHSWVHVMGQDNTGQRQVFAAEWASVSRLERDGITARTIQVGDIVRIWAAPNRNPHDNRVHLKRIERRADKWKWGGRGNQDAR